MVNNLELFPNDPVARRIMDQQNAPWPKSGGRIYTVGVVSTVAPVSDELVQLVAMEHMDCRRVLSDSITSGLQKLGDIDVLLLDLTKVDWIAAGPLTNERGDATTPVLAAVKPEALRILETQVAADDFLVWPWSLGELSIRVRRLMERRNQIQDDAPGIIRANGLMIDTNRYDVFVGDRLVVLTFKEYELLKLLASHPGRVFTREALLGQVWGYEYFGGTRTVDVHVRRLRSKTEDGDHIFIDTVWNVGYRFRS